MIVIPMAGDGRRFQDVGFTVPKPFIPVLSEPMVKRVIESIRLPEEEYILLIRQEHLQYKPLLDSLKVKWVCVPVLEKTDGTARTVLSLKDFIDKDDDLLIVNSDQMFCWDPQQLKDIRLNKSIDGCIFCFYGTGNQYSYAKVDENNRVLEVAEKKQISEHATGGMYWFRKSEDFFYAAEKMIEKNLRVNGEFYVAPVYNELLDKYNIIEHVSGVIQLGTPEDLSKYYQDYYGNT